MCNTPETLYVYVSKALCSHEYCDTFKFLNYMLKPSLKVSLFLLLRVIVIPQCIHFTQISSKKYPTSQTFVR